MGVKKRRTPAPKNAPTTATAAGVIPPVGPGIEFWHADDEAWYNVQLILFNEILLVKFIEFPDDHDLEFHAAEITTASEISDFRQRFRPLGVQLEASDCPIVTVGMRVCALTFSVICLDDRRFYDAIVEAVKHEKHTFEYGKENCPCTVILSWLHGPKAGTLTAARVEDLCPIQSHNQLDPRVACFLELAKWKHGITSERKSEGQSQMESAVPYYEGTEDVDLGGGGHVYAMKTQNDDYSFFSLNKLEGKCSISLRGSDTKDKIADPESRFFIVVENLEKDVTRSTIMDFVLEATGLAIKAFVFLSLSSEPYTRGALVVDCKEDLERLRNFLVTPEHMITSTRGRPWIVTDVSATESVRPFWSLESDLKDERRQSTGDGLKIVQLGSEEYSKAEKLRDLYVKFTDHQQLVFKRLALEEQRIFDA